MLLYRVLDALVDSYFPVLSRLDEQIDELEDEILQDRRRSNSGPCSPEAVPGRAPEGDRARRDMFATPARGEHLPGMTPDAERYFRDLYDHLIRISDLVDSYRDLTAEPSTPTCPPSPTG